MLWWWWIDFTYYDPRRTEYIGDIPSDQMNLLDRAVGPCSHIQFLGIAALACGRRLLYAPIIAPLS
jgi:hypothetical protein